MGMYAAKEEVAASADQIWGLIASLVATLGVGVYVAYILTWLWLWFAVPMGAPSVGLFQAYGLALIVGLLTARPATFRDIREQAYQARCAALAVLKARGATGVEIPEEWSVSIAWAGFRARAVAASLCWGLGWLASWGMP